LGHTTGDHPFPVLIRIPGKTPKEVPGKLFFSGYSSCNLVFFTGQKQVCDERWIFLHCLFSELKLSGLAKVMKRLTAPPSPGMSLNMNSG
jgi:hypothetical protein